jgi:hypothetical protein
MIHVDISIADRIPSKGSIAQPHPDLPVSLSSILPDKPNFPFWAVIQRRDRADLVETVVFLKIPA